VIYFGHSQGTTQWFVANALHNDLSQYFKAFIGIAPVGTVGHQESALLTALDLLNIADLFYEYFKTFLYFPHITKIAEPVIHLLPRTVWAICSALCGYDTGLHISLEELPMMARNDVGGTSTKNMMHWLQDVRTKGFNQFDYGADQNELVYGSNKAPAYDMDAFKSNVANVPMLMVVGDNDWLVAPDDYKFLANYIPETSKVINVPDYNHLDCMWGVDTNNVINDQVFVFLESL